MIRNTQIHTSTEKDKQFFMLQTDVSGVIIGRNANVLHQTKIQIGDKLSGYLQNRSEFEVWSNRLSKSGIEQSVHKFYMEPPAEQLPSGIWEVCPIHLESDQIILVWTYGGTDTDLNQPAESIPGHHVPTFRTIQNLLHALHDAVFIYDEFGHILAHNKAASYAYADQQGVLQGVFLEDGTWKPGQPDSSSTNKNYLHKNVILEHKVYNGQIANHVDTDAHTWRSISARPIELDEYSGVLAMIVCTDITGQKELEETLVRDRQMFVNGPSVLFNWISQEDWPVEYVSPNVYDEFGYAPGDFISGKLKFKELVHPDDLAHIQLLIDTHKEQGRFHYSLEYRILHAKGHYIPVLDSSMMIRNKEGVVKQHRGYLINISNLKEKQQELLKSEQRMALAMSAANDGLWDWQIPTRESYWSDRVFEMLGFQAGSFKVSYHKWRSLVHPHDQNQVFGAIRKWLKNKTCTDQLTLEYRICKADGNYIWMLTRGNIAEWDEQGIPSRVIGTHADITAKKENESLMRRSELIMKSILDTSDEAHFLLSPEGIILGFNEVVNSLGNKLLGRPIELGQNISEYSSPDNGIVFQDKLSRTRAGESFRSERKLDFINNQSLWVVEKFMPVYDENEKLTGIALTYDLSFNKIKNQKEKLSEIAFMQSHVIRKPLANILGLLQYIKLGTPNQDYAEVYHFLEKSAEELDEVIGKIISETHD